MHTHALINDVAMKNLSRWNFQSHLCLEFFESGEFYDAIIAIVERFKDKKREG